MNRIEKKHLPLLYTRYLLVSLLLFAHTFSSAKVVQKPLNHAMKSYLKGNLKSALALFQRERALDREDPTPYFYIGNIYYDLGQFRSARSSYERALSLDPKSSEILIALGNTLKRQGDASGALLIDSLAFKQKNNSANLLVLSVSDILKNIFDQGLTDLAKGRLTSGFQKMQKILSWEPVAVAEYYSGLILMRSQKLEEAKLHLEKALAQDPNNVHFHIALGRLYLEQGEYNDAIKEFERAIPADTTQQSLIPKEAFIGLGHARLEKGGEELKEILPTYLRATRRDPLRLPFHYRWGMIYLRTGLLDNAIFHFQKALAANAQHTSSFLYMGIALFRKGELIEAKPKKKKVIGTEISPEDLYSSAVFSMQKTLQLYPFSSLAHLYLGRAFLKERKPKHALLALRKAEAISPRSSDVHLYLGIALSQLKLSFYAVREFLTAIRLNSKSALAHFSLGMAYRQLSLPQQAIDAFLRAHKLKPSNQNILFALSSTYMVVGDTSRAFIFLKQALRLEPDYIQTLMDEAAESYSQGFLDSAITTYKRVLKADSRNARAHFALGFVYFVKGQQQKALSFLKQGLKLDPSLPVSSTARYLIESIQQKRPI